MTLGLILCFIGFELKSVRITLLELDWFYDILDLATKKTWAILLDWDWFCYEVELDWRNEITKKRCH